MFQGYPSHHPGGPPPPMGGSSSPPTNTSEMLGGPASSLPSMSTFRGGTVPHTSAATYSSAATSPAVNGTDITSSTPAANSNQKTGDMLGQALASVSTTISYTFRVFL